MIKTRNAVFIISGGVILTGLALSRINRNWLILNSFVGVSLIYSGITGFSILSDILEKLGLTMPDYGHYEEERLKDKNKLKIIRKIRKIRREISDYIKEAEAGRVGE